MRSEFPLLNHQPNLVYLDHAATSQKPKTVIDRIQRFYERENASPNRGAYALSTASTALYEQARAHVLRFVGAPETSTLVFTKNTTEALNLVAHSFPFKAGDEIVVGICAHHSVIVPLQMAARRAGATLKYIYVDGVSGHFSKEQLAVITSKTAFVAFPWIDNAIGVIYDVQALVARARAVGATILIDAAQAMGHIEVDFKVLDADFLTFSGHKLYGPQGIGALVAKSAALEGLTPFLLGGDMIEYVEEQTTTFAEIPKRFEAGTQNVEGAVGLEAAVAWLEQYPIKTLISYEAEITAYAMRCLSQLPYVTILGPELEVPRGALVSFEVEGIHAHDLASLLDERGICVRAGHHCCQPYMKHLGRFGTCRASFSAFSQKTDIDALVMGIKHAREVFGYEC